MKRGNRKLGALLAVWLMLWTGGPARASDITIDINQDQGATVRVLLTRVQGDRLSVALDGSYTLEPFGLAFQRGSKLVFAWERDALALYYEGMAVSAEAFTLRRHALPPSAAPDEENGLRFNGQLNLFAGDLTLTAAEGLVRPVFTVPMEIYLLGVVPYEMSDTIPMEALKAQAVTARTYAQRRLGSSRDYDLVANTNDQVYYGQNAAHKRSAQAVRETAGLCGYIGGALAHCFYSASNGGQTELMQNVWPDGGRELFIVRDDPYDLQNPKSQVRVTQLPREWPKPGTDRALDGLAGLLKPELAEPLLALGYDGDGQYIRITGVEKAELHTPRHAPPSRLMTMLRLWVRVDARKELEQVPPDPDAGSDPTVIPAPQWTAMGPVAEAIEVDIPLFPDAKRLLGLSINPGNNELITLHERENGFTLEARRFGHGVGMSQRGAEWMAGAEQWTFEQILHFYYPGIQLMSNPAQQTPAPTLPPPVDAAFLNTPAPPATATPRPTPMPLSQAPQGQEWLGEVTAMAEDSWLNLRTEPATSGKVLGTLFLDQSLLVLEELPDGWLRVKTDVIEGYVMAQFVKRAGE